MLIDTAIISQLEIILRGSNGMYVSSDSSDRSVFVSEKDDAEKFTVYQVDSSTIKLYSKRLQKFLTRWADHAAVKKSSYDEFCYFKVGEINGLITLQGDNKNYLSYLLNNGNSYLMLNSNNIDSNAKFYVEI